jgi:hypothetical protein
MAMAATVTHFGHYVSTRVMGLLWVVSYLGICRVGVYYT